MHSLSLPHTHCRFIKLIRPVHKICHEWTWHVKYFAYRVNIYLFAEIIVMCRHFWTFMWKTYLFDWYNDAFLLDKWWSENDQQLIIREIKYPLSNVDWHTFACLLSILNQFRSFVYFTKKIIKWIQWYSGDIFHIINATWL